MADISKIKLPDGTTYNVKDTTKVSTSGDTMTGALNMAGSDISLNTSSSSSDDSGDIVWTYGNGQEKARLWTDNEYSSAIGLNYRIYKKDGTNVYNGTIPLTDTNTTYTLSVSGNNIVLTPSSGSANTITVPYATSAGSASPTSGSTYYIQNCTNSSRSTATSGSWMSMVNSSADGSPVTPTAGWWTVLSADCWNSAPYNWTSQLAIATQDTNGVWWRRNDSGGTSIDSSAWRRLAEGDSNGNASVANKLGTSTVGGTTAPIYLNAGTPTALSYTIAKSVPSNAVFTDTKVTQTALTNVSDNGEYYILMSPKNSSSTETNTSTKFKGLYFYNGDLIVGDGEHDDKTRIGTTSINTKYLNCDVRIYTPSVICTDIACNNISVADISCSSMSVTDISSQYSFSKTSGNWTYQGIRAVRCGNVVAMQIIIKGGTSVSAGSNALVGTLSGGPLPARVDNGTQDSSTSGVNFYGTSALVGTLTSSGIFTLRLLITAQSLGTNTTSMYFTFVCD